MALPGPLHHQRLRRSPREIPVLREKVAEVMRRSELPASSHDGKALMHILEILPRDELFQSTTDELLRDRHGCGAAAGTPASEAVHAPRQLRPLLLLPRLRAARPLQQPGTPENPAHPVPGLNGKSVEHNVTLSESALARMHIIVRTTPWKLPKYDRVVTRDRRSPWRYVPGRTNCKTC